MSPCAPSMALPAGCAVACTPCPLQPHRPAALHARARVPAALHTPACAMRGAQPPCVRRRHGAVRCTAQVTTADLAVGETRVASSGAVEGFWEWRGHRIRYQQLGSEGPAMVLVHGFGGNCDQWRQNIPELSKAGRVFAIDLLGYGYSAKPDPKAQAAHTLYTFDTWADQLNDFIEQMVGEPAFLVTNSIGGVAGLQAAVNRPELCQGLCLVTLSLRGLNIRKQSALIKPFVAALQRTLRETSLGVAFFNALAKPRTVKNVLRQAYAGNPDAVTDELVDFILTPGLQPGAAPVFLEFISFSEGPIPEDLLEVVKPPVCLMWGTADPWEPYKDGKEYAKYDSVVEFIPLQGVGHCPMDENPALVNPKIVDFVTRTAAAANS